MQMRQDIATKQPSGPVMVCGRQLTVDPVYVPQEIYQDLTLYFCTESCLNAFRTNPERFYCAHNKTAPK
jgi:YHS domain-containing protein